MLPVIKPSKEFFRTILQKGLVWTVPALLTLWLISVVCNVADVIMGPITRTLLRTLVPEWLLVGPISNGESPIISLLLLVLLLAMIGGFVSWRYGELIARTIDRWISSFPGIGFIYRSTRTIANVFDGTKASPFQRVVLVPYPNEHVYTLAFAVGPTIIRHLDGKDEEVLRVVVPNPPTGLQGIIFVPKSKVKDVNMPVAAGLQFYLSAGMVAPDVINIEPPEDQTALPRSDGQ